jgi:hypothetical protein
MLVRLIVLLFAMPVFAAQWKSVTFEDSMTVDGKKLELNAPLSIRRVTRFGIPIKVYVGDFYVQKKATDLNGMIEQPRPLFFKQVYLLSIDRKDIVEGWTKAFEDNCEKDCDKAKQGLKEFNDLVTDVRDGTQVTIKITKDSLEIDNQGKPEKKGIVKNEAFANAFMYIFFGKNPPDEKFQKELIGQAKE